MKYGKFLGYDKSTICLNEKKGHKPSINFIYAVSKATGVPIDYIAEKLIGPYLPEPELMKYLDHEKLKKFTKKSTWITYFKEKAIPVSRKKNTD